MTGGASRAPTARNSRSLRPTVRSISTSPDIRNTSWRNSIPATAVTYQAHGDDWFVISGTKGDGIFYERYMLSHGKEMAEGFVEGFVMSYPAALKQTYDPIVARMAKSFRSGTGFQTPKR